jgi:glycolate oxidase iron-sulfur subunit
MNELLAAADSCVKCGLCLPHCPTYTHTQNENESPRGRIALIQGWAGQQLVANDTLLGHIDNCLLCRACERVCPAVVPYAQLIDHFRAQVYPNGGHTLAVALMKKVAHSKKARAFAQKSMKLYQTSLLQKTARWLKLPQLLRLNALDRLLPAYQAPVALTTTEFAATATARGQVGLFVGCMGQLLDHETVQAAIKVLNAAGFDVHIPAQQVCCGALAAHGGDRDTATALEKLNEHVFGQRELAAIVSIASGCGSQLREYQNRAFADKVMDISAFLTAFGAELSGRLLPLDKAVVVHTPCSLKNVLRTEQSVFKLLAQIPDIRTVALPETVQCCGSAGSYMLEHPKMAQLLLDDVLNVALAKQPDMLVSSNIGCALHIAAGLRERGLGLEVIHPVVLMARQLREA